ncbi:hypothetical protein TK5_25920 [Sideroxyarcus sp. TK5]
MNGPKNLGRSGPEYFDTKPYNEKEHQQTCEKDNQQKPSKNHQGYVFTGEELKDIRDAPPFTD